jgi:hypothetical protein
MTTDNFYRVVLVAGGVMDPGEKTPDSAETTASREVTSGVVSEYLAKLRAVIEATHGCEAVHAASVPVREELRHQKVWDGIVEVFALSAHPQTNRCYAWGHRKADGEWAVTTVPAIVPIDSPEAAVRSTVS